MVRRSENFFNILIKIEHFYKIIILEICSGPCAPVPFLLGYYSFELEAKPELQKLIKTVYLLTVNILKNSNAHSNLNKNHIVISSIRWSKTCQLPCKMPCEMPCDALRNAELSWCPGAVNESIVFRMYKVCSKKQLCILLLSM